MIDYNIGFPDSSTRLKNLVAAMTLKNSYWGYLFSRILRIEDEMVPSIMAVCIEDNGTVALRFNSELVKGTDDDNLMLVLEHEGMHLLNNHLARLLRFMNNA